MLHLRLAGTSFPPAAPSFSSLPPSLPSFTGRLSITRMRGEKKGLDVSGQLHEYGKTGFEAMFPVDAKSQSLAIKTPASFRPGDTVIR